MTCFTGKTGYSSRISFATIQAPCSSNNWQTLLIASSVRTGLTPFSYLPDASLRNPNLREVLRMDTLSKTAASNNTF